MASLEEVKLEQDVAAAEAEVRDLEQKLAKLEPESRKIQKTCEIYTAMLAELYETQPPGYEVQCVAIHTRRGALWSLPAYVETSRLARAIIDAQYEQERCMERLRKHQKRRGAGETASEPVERRYTSCLTAPCLSCREACI